MYYLEKIRTKALLALAPVLLFAGLALMPSAAMAEAEPCVNNILCDNAGNALRDDNAAPENYGTDMLATNTLSTLRLLALGPGGEPIAANSNPANYAYFGVELESNPATSCQEGKEEATGSVTFADIQNASPSPVFSGVAPEIKLNEAGERVVSSFGPWPISVRSDHCETNPGKVTVSNVHLFFPEIAEGVSATATGTFTGTYVQPNVNTCEGGGMKLDVNQPGVVVEALGSKFGAAIDNGIAGENAFLCFVSANNYLYPKTAPNWEPLEGAIWKD